MKFNYQARTKTGELLVGTVEASSKEVALSLLQRQKLFVTYLEPAEAAPIFGRRIQIFRGISSKELVLFSRQLSILFKSKVPLVESLQILAFQTKNPIFSEKIMDLSKEVEGGTAFSGALSRHPDLFSTFYISMVKSGEASGTLSESLEYLANHLEREYDLTSTIKGAMIYPALVIAVMVVILGIMTFFVMPQLTEILEATGQELPLITKLIIGLTNFIRSWGWLVFLVLGFLAFLIYRYSKSAEGKKFLDQYILKIPIIGPAAKMIYLSRLAENLSTLISGGLPIVQALLISGDVVGNDVYKSIIFQTSEEVKTGGSISSVLTGYPEAFPPVFVQMVLVGEKTGTLDKSLMHLVRFYKKEVDRSIKGLVSLLEPLLIVFLGIGVAIMVMGVLMPLYQAISAGPAG